MPHWLHRGALAWGLLPVSGLAWLVLWARRWLGALNPAKPLPVPVVVVGNLLVGSTGKTPVVVALVRALQQAGLQVGVVSRGYGRRTREVRTVQASSTSADVGDEPLLLHRLTGAPVVVGARRREAALALLMAHRGTQVIVSDDGLQHMALPKDFSIAVFDERGVGNGWLLPAGPLRQPLRGPLAPRLDAVLYNAPAPTTAWPGLVLLAQVGQPIPLSQWRGDSTAIEPIVSPPTGRVLAAAGIGQPERFFQALQAQGLAFERLALPDHASLDPLPWQAEAWDAIVVTEKDAVKLDPRHPGNARVWVVPHAVRLPDGLLAQVLGTVKRHGHPPT